MRLLKPMTVILFIGVEASAGGLSQPVFQYEPHVTTLIGTLSTRVYPGPPNYESVKRGDRPEKIWLLELPHPISMEPDQDPTSINEKETGIREIHVLLTDLRGEKELKRHKGETVTFTGAIFHAHTIHHPLALLMEVQSYWLHKGKGSNR